jgi:hypothetical protein
MEMVLSDPAFVPESQQEHKLNFAVQQNNCCAAAMQQMHASE